MQYVKGTPCNIECVFGELVVRVTAKAYFGGSAYLDNNSKGGM